MAGMIETMIRNAAAYWRKRRRRKLERDQFELVLQRRNDHLRADIGLDDPDFRCDRTAPDASWCVGESRVSHRA